MCGIFGMVSNVRVNYLDVKILSSQSERRGKDSSGFFLGVDNNYAIFKAAFPVTNLLDQIDVSKSKLLFGHSRLITNGLSDNQPVYRDGVCVVHNGIVVNHEDLWHSVSLKRGLVVDTEIIAAIVIDHLNSNGSVDDISSRVLQLCEGIVACAIAIPRLGKLCLFSNNGSLFFGVRGEDKFFASERYSLELLGCKDIVQVRSNGVIIDIPFSYEEPTIVENNASSINLIPDLGTHKQEESMLEYKNYNLIRCKKCILPQSMPFIKFDDSGVCNYCKAYKPRNRPRPVEELYELVQKYRRISGDECIVPFSGGRDSSYGLHLIVNELKMKPVTYTYDWGMVTDLGRRNISRMCAKLGVENIVIADDIALKRRNIAKNFKAWLQSPHLGMVSILTAGDKHFFRHVESVKTRTGISLNLWGVNPLEVTHFKAGFLGVPPDFAEDKVYSSGALKQMRYQYLRFMAMAQSPGYFNSSLWDTLSGEYYRSFHAKKDYFHIFDYWRWDETAPDTNTTWRIGDGTAAIYNYIYRTVAGFSEHDTFRSNQIREGDLTREEALILVEDENQPRYPNIKWYLDAIGMDFHKVIPLINSIPKIFK
jgi:glucosamine--fructose-6-phosphate aminotransferase (isomerizing)